MSNFAITENLSDRTYQSSSSKRSIDVNDVLVRINRLSKEANDTDTDIAAKLNIRHNITRLSASIPALQEQNTTNAEHAISDADRMLAQAFDNIRANSADAFAAASISNNEDVYSLLS